MGRPDYPGEQGTISRFESLERITCWLGSDPFIGLSYELKAVEDGTKKVLIPFLSLRCVWLLVPFSVQMLTIWSMSLAFLAA